MIYELLKICEHASYKTIEIDMKNQDHFEILQPQI